MGLLGRAGCEFWECQCAVARRGVGAGAHGANRTGRVFTGDASGEWLYRALHKAGFANQPHATDRADGLQLIDCAITAAVHCAPPDNMPSREERDRCRPWLESTIDLLPVKVVVCAGRVGVAGVAATNSPAGVVHGPGAEVRARSDGPPGGWTVAFGQLPSEPAEHEHGPADGADAGFGVCTALSRCWMRL